MLTVGSVGSPTLHARHRTVEELEELVEHRPLDEHAAPCATILAGIGEDPGRRLRRGPLQVGVCEHDRGRLAPELQGDPFDGTRGAGHDLPPDLGGAGEGDLGDVRVLDQAGADHRPLAGYHLEHPLGQPGVEGELGQAEGGEGGGLGRFDHDGVAGGEGRPHLPRGDRDREVPGDDGPDHAERLVKGHVHPAGHRDGGAAVLVHRARVEVQHLGHHPDLIATLADRLAHVGRLHLGQLLGVVLDLGGEPAHQAGTVCRREGPPCRPGVRGTSDRDVDLLDTHERHLGDDALGARVHDRS